MTSSFKSKTEKFASEIQSDLKSLGKPILKHSKSTDAGIATDAGDEPRTYREESRVAQYGKHDMFLRLLCNYSFIDFAFKLLCDVHCTI